VHAAQGAFYRRITNATGCRVYQYLDSTVAQAFPSGYRSEAIFASRCRKADSSCSRRRGCVVVSRSPSTRLRDNSRLSRSAFKRSSSGVGGVCFAAARRAAASSIWDSTSLLSQPRDMPPLSRYFRITLTQIGTSTAQNTIHVQRLAKLNVYPIPNRLGMNIDGSAGL